MGAVRVVVASETGNAAQVADQLAAALRGQDIEVDLSILNKVDPQDLPGFAVILGVVSTTGDGEMPFEGLKGWDVLQNSEVRLDGIPFAVLGLGDTGYFDFCQAAIDLDARLEAMGGERLFEVRKCDVDYDDEAADWIDAVIPVVSERLGLAAAEVPVHVEREVHAWTRGHPFPATILVNRVLTAPTALKEVRHIEVSVAGWGLNYRPGDALGIVPANDPALVDALLAHLGESGDREIDGRPLRNHLALEHEISRPSRALVDHVVARTSDAEAKAVLGGTDRAMLREFLFARDVLDLLELTDERPTAEELLALLGPLSHRSYSIASSSRVDADTIALTVAVLRYAERGRERGGVASTHLADRLAVGSEVGVFLVTNEHFQPPADDDVPMIMIGPGTGVAPFRGFLHERRARGAKGRNWLFFGSRSAVADFLYGAEFTAMAEDGLLARLDCAFSRDQADKIYVQHRMREQGAEIYAWLAEGAHVFVCGDEHAMAGDVDRALHEIVAEHGALSADAAAAYVDELRSSGRYARDVY